MRPLAKDVRELKIENSKKQLFKYLNLFLLKKVLCGGGGLSRAEKQEL
jgi:hypothetical protein